LPVKDFLGSFASASSMHSKCPNPQVQVNKNLQLKQVQANTQNN